MRQIISQAPHTASDALCLPAPEPMLPAPEPISQLPEQHCSSMKPAQVHPVSEKKQRQRRQRNKATQYTSSPDNCQAAVNEAEVAAKKANAAANEALKAAKEARDAAREVDILTGETELGRQIREVLQDNHKSIPYIVWDAKETRVWKIDPKFGKKSGAEVRRTPSAQPLQLWEHKDTALKGFAAHLEGDIKCIISAIMTDFHSGGVESRNLCVKYTERMFRGRANVSMLEQKLQIGLKYNRNNFDFAEVVPWLLVDLPEDEANTTEAKVLLTANDEELDRQISIIQELTDNYIAETAKHERAETKAKKAKAAAAETVASNSNTAATTEASDTDNTAAVAEAVAPNNTAAAEAVALDSTITPDEPMLSGCEDDTDEDQDEDEDTDNIDEEDATDIDFEIEDSSLAACAIPPRSGIGVP